MVKKQSVYVDGLQYALPTRAYFEEARDAGLDIIHVTVVFWENIHETMTLLGDWFRLFDAHADLLYPATSVDGFEPKLDDARIGVVFGFQNCSSIENNIDMIELYRRLNVGVMQLSYNNQSHLCGGCYEQADIGLSRFGRAAVKEMNRVGMIIDMSHSSRQATIEAIEASQRPITISHAQSLHFQPALRNKGDDVLKLLAESGGIFGLSFYPFHLKNTSDCQLSDLMDEIKRLIDLIGVDTIAIGTDICQGREVAVVEYMRNGHWTKEMDYGEGSKDQSGWPAPPKWFSRVADFAHLQSAMVDHGIGAEDSAKIMGGNWMRYFAQSLTPQSGLNG